MVTFHFFFFFLFSSLSLMDIKCSAYVNVFCGICNTIPNVLTQYLQGLMARLSLTQMGLRSELNVEFVSQMLAMKVQNKLCALPFHQLCPLPFNFRNQLKKKDF